MILSAGCTHSGIFFLSFLAGLLVWKDPQILVPALQIAELQMEKLPETFSKMFVREGVVHSVDSLIAAPTTSVIVQSNNSERMLGQHWDHQHVLDDLGDEVETRSKMLSLSRS